MQFSTFFKLSAFLATAAVQVTAAQFNVTVGGPSLVFTPQSVTAQPGDVIFFTFQQKNHTVTQSTFDVPCQRSAGGFDSGFMPVSANNTSGPFPAAQLTVRTTDPVWIYCRQGNHCQQGMVFAVNPGDKFDAYKANAMGNNTSVSPSSTPATGTSTSVASNPTPTSTGTDHRVTVGASGLNFSPSNLTAQPGDTVTFEFRPKNHTATQSTFANPCSPMANGFNSGFTPVGTDATTFPTFTVKVNDTSPVWVYCAQSGHCSSGMVFAINAPATGNTFDAFKAKAMGSSSTSPSGTGSPAPTTSSTSGAGKTYVQSVAGLSVALLFSLTFLL